MKFGSLCTGYGGLDLAVGALLGTETVWLSEIDANAAKVCEARFPGVPNLGDLTTIDWSSVEPVDVLTAGYPCQPFSHAGKRQGTDDDRHIWPFILDALRVLRPRLAVFENVAGHLSLGFDAVLGDLASIGFDAEWCVVRASDVGACHQRKRLFIVAHDTQSDPWGLVDGERLRPTGDPSDADQSGLEGAEPERRHLVRAGGGRGTPAHSSRERHGRGKDGRVVGRVDGEDAGGARERERPRTVAGDRGDADAADSDGGRCEVRGGREHAGSELRRGADERSPVAWGDYRPAIERHASLVGRAAPAPTDDTGRLSASFVEWMMCLPDGWVTDILPRNPALKALGNGVVPPQAAYALAHLLDRTEQREAAA